MPKLTPRQTTILAAAAGRQNGAVLPLPADLKLNKAAATIVINSLLKAALLAERAAAANEAVWRSEADGQDLTLVVTDASRAAVGADSATPPAAPADAPAKAAGRRSAATRPPQPAQPVKSGGGTAGRTGTKQALLIDLLRRKKGAALDEIIAATGWQAHSVRGAISGGLKKKLGYPVERVVVAGRGRVYRIVGGSR
jgi:hypothetical protein